MAYRDSIKVTVTENPRQVAEHLIMTVIGRILTIVHYIESIQEK